MHVSLVGSYSCFSTTVTYRLELLQLTCVAHEKTRTKNNTFRRSGDEHDEEKDKKQEQEQDKDKEQEDEEEEEEA